MKINRVICDGCGVECPPNYFEKSIKIIKYGYQDDKNTAYKYYQYCDICGPKEIEKLKKPDVCKCGRNHSCSCSDCV